MVFFLDVQTGLDIKPESENEFYKKEAKDMVNIVQRLIADGECWTSSILLFLFVWLPIL